MSACLSVSVRLPVLLFVCLSVSVCVSSVKRTLNTFENSWYRNDPKFSDSYAWANSADLSGSTLFAILSASFGLITLW